MQNAKCKVHNKAPMRKRGLCACAGGIVKKIKNDTCNSRKIKKYRERENAYF